jgi:hypothetical protein
VDVFHHGLEGVETAGFRDFDFGAEILDEVFEDDAIGAGEKGEDGFDKVAFIVVKFGIPVGLVAGEIDFFGGPEGVLVVFIGLPDCGVLDREETVTLGRCDESGRSGRGRNRGHFFFNQILFLGFRNLFRIRIFLERKRKFLKQEKKNWLKKNRNKLFFFTPFVPQENYQNLPVP